MRTKRSFLIASLVCYHIALPVIAVENSPSSSNEVVNYLDLNIRDYKAKALPFSEVLSAGQDGIKKVLFDQSYRGRLCLISCHFYDGYTSKWSGYYLDLQPYESTCSALAGGCTTITFPKPDYRIKISVGNQEFNVAMTDESQYRYYLPLALRQAIVANEVIPVTIETKWDKYPNYRIGDKSRKLLGAVLNRNDEIEPPRMINSSIQSVEERLKELMGLREKGLIDQQEYNRLRQKALGL